MHRNSPVEGAVVALGTFDGVHRGHQAILKRTAAQARQLGLPAVAYTLFPHPRAVLTPGQELPLLTVLSERKRLLKAYGMDRVVVQTFDATFAALTPEEFLERVVLAHLRARRVVVGFNYTFGQGGRAGAERLRELGEARGLRVEIVPPVCVDGTIVSSSVIRSLLARGELEQANQFLGYAYTLSGRVVRGEGRGKALGFPTANLLLPPQKLLPQDGVYAVSVTLPQGRVYPALLSIGPQPTFGGAERRVEVFIPDLNEDLYGRVLEVGVQRRLRDIQRFPTPQALAEQIKQDLRAITIYNEKAGML
ncbi:MAG: bifunctional riboflavin kinase/FAD synthetase [Bacillota bacterium]|nr:bifunctional riboflavin kinase/FAD synthetase [Bacillota bacterium]